MATINVRAVFALVIDGKKPDGTPATDEEAMAALAICHEHDQALCELFSVARFGERLDGGPVDWDERDAALKRLTKLVRGPAEKPVRHEFAALADDLSELPDTRANRRLRAAHHLGAGPALRPQRDWTHVAVDVPTRLDAIAGELGLDRGVLVAPFARGRPSAAETARRDALAIVVHRLRQEGGGLEAIGSAVGTEAARIGARATRSRAGSGGWGSGVTTRFLAG